MVDYILIVMESLLLLRFSAGRLRPWNSFSAVVFLFCAVMATNLPAQTFTSQVSFDGSDGANPFAGLVQGIDGNLYGTTVYGGTNGYGTIFKVTPSGTLTTLYTFCSQSECTDGSEPFVGLDLATNGDLFGTTRNGGIDGTYGPGTLFKTTPGGTLTTLHEFCSLSCSDGESPLGVLVQAANGDFFGTTYSLGENGQGGTIFKISPTGTLTTLYSFCAQSGCADGGGPVAGLLEAANGNFYGTTYYGGAYGLGTVFEITPSGALTTLHSFCSPDEACADGQSPECSLIQASDGDLYGTTNEGGAGGAGTVFKITPSGTLTTIFSFCITLGCMEGSSPATGLIQATDGNFYGDDAERRHQHGWEYL